MNDSQMPGLYVHVPFCESKCPYCDFYSVTSRSHMNKWLAALERETALYKDRFPLFDSLYMGGGTPSLLDDQTLTSLTKGLFRQFTISSDAEVTIECNPDDVTPGKAALFLALGVNRVSLGVQSFDDGELAFLKRRHNAGQAEKAFTSLRRAGFDNIGIDLMYGLPGQTESDWLETLDRALEFEPAHLSCYELTISAGTPFARMREEGVFAPLEEEEGRALFLATAQYLADRGYIHYEVSNFAKEKKFMCRHNRKYWKRTPYLGLGPSAHSFAHGKRWWNARSVSHYCEHLFKGRSPVEGSEKLSRDQASLESLALGFRTKEGLDETLFHNRPQAHRIITELCASGLVSREDGRILPTPKGFLVADSLPLLFY